MAIKTVNSKSLPSGRGLENLLDELWEQADDAAPIEIKNACKDARRNMLRSKSPEQAKAWRDVMDNLFTLFVSKANILLV